MEQKNCKQCGQTGEGNFCQACGEAYHQHRITLKHMLHEAAHLITHLDKGFFYSLKAIVTRPGTTPREYIDGRRKDHQKPFSMFFLCGTIAALCLYWINTGTDKLHHDKISHEEEHFYQHYFVLLQMALVPLYALVNRLIYYKSKYNYAEFLVVLLYNTAFLYIILVFVNCLKLAFGQFETGFIEAGVVLAYNLITYINFFREDKRWLIILKVFMTTIICFFISKYATDLFIEIFLNKKGELISDNQMLNTCSLMLQYVV